MQFDCPPPLSRRALGALAAALALPGCATLSAASASSPRGTIKPQRLRAGDTVGLIAPSGALTQAQLSTRVKNMEDLGFKVKLGKNVLARWGSYGGSIEQRLEDLRAMFADESVRVIWAARGGSGGTGLLPHLDYGLIARNPKVLIGYSDLTAVLHAIHAKTGLITFHGPTAGSRFTDYNLQHLRALLFDGQAGHVMHHAPENLPPLAKEAVRDGVVEPANEVKTYKEGVATGPLLPGNLSLIAALQGTPYALRLAGALLCIEEVGEEPYRVDRLLHQLQQSNPRGGGAFAECAGVLVGVLTRYAAKPDDKQLSLREVLDHHLTGLSIPAASGYSFGHIAHQMTLPVGAMARLDTTAGTLTVLESVVE